MIHYIKIAFLTIIEALLFFFTAAYVLYIKFNISGTKNFYIVLLFGMLILVVTVKSLFARFKRYYILHFSIRKVDRMTGEEFELFLKLHFEQLGCAVSMTSISGDYGADLILDYKDRIVAVQAKRHNSVIGVKAIQEVIGSMAYYEADVGLVVTNSTYTRNAIELADANDIILWDRDILVQMMNRENMSGYLNEFL